MSKPLFVTRIQKGDDISYVKVLRKRVNIASFGILDTEDLADNQAAVEKLLEQAPHVFKEATKAEYDAFEKWRKDTQKEREADREKANKNENKTPGKDIPEKPALVIGLEQDGKTSYVKVTRRRVNVGSIGIVQPADLAGDEASVKRLYAQAPHVFKEATKAEYDAFEKWRKEQQEADEESAEGNSEKSKQSESAKAKAAEEAKAKAAEEAKAKAAEEAEAKAAEEAKAKAAEEAKAKAAEEAEAKAAEEAEAKAESENSAEKSKSKPKKEE